MFVNEAFNKGINDYLMNKDNVDSIIYNSFLAVVIRMLANIYGELDIITPFQLGKEELLDNNLMKYGATKEEINYFKKLLECFYDLDKKNENNINKEDNIYFVEVQKKLVDFYNYKRLYYGVTDEEKNEFFDLLYTKKTSNPLRYSYNYLNAIDEDEVLNYYLVQNNKKLEAKKEEKDLLPRSVYTLFNFNDDDINNMSPKEINDINREIYRHFDIKENDENRKVLLEEKIKAIIPKEEPLTTGNGYVDILLIMSIIVTVGMIVTIFLTLVF